MPRKSRNSRLGGVRGSETVSALTTAGATSPCTIADVRAVKGRSFRCLKVVAQVTMFVGTTGLVEITMLNQAQTKIATSGPIMLTQGVIKTVTVKPPPGADIVFDEGNTTNTNYKLVLIDAPCLSKEMATFRIHTLLHVYYVLTPEMYDDNCPSIRMLREVFPQRTADESPPGISDIISLSSCISDV